MSTRKPVTFLFPAASQDSETPRHKCLNKAHNSQLHSQHFTLSTLHSQLSTLVTELNAACSLTYSDNYFLKF